MQPRGGPLLIGAGHDEYPSRFDVDMETQMLGSVKPYALQVRPDRRAALAARPNLFFFPFQVVVSTGKSDWDREVTDTSGSLAKYLDAARGEYKPPPKDKSAKDAAPADANGAHGPPGLHRSTESSKVTILNGSHRSVSEDAARETVLVFPEYRVVTEVERTADGARKFWHSLRTGAQESEGLKTYVLPYSSVIMLCEFSWPHTRESASYSLPSCRLAQAAGQPLRHRSSQARAHLHRRARARGLGGAHASRGPLALRASAGGAHRDGGGQARRAREAAQGRRGAEARPHRPQLTHGRAQVRWERDRTSAASL